MTEQVHPCVQEYLEERGLHPTEVQIKERLHIEKIDKSGDEPKVVGYMIVENGQVVHKEGE